MAEKKYIEREAFRREIDEHRPGRSYEDAWALTILDSIPAADVRPVVRARWEIKGEFANCTVCKEDLRIECGIELFDEMPHFCPNCGCAMEGTE